MALQWLQTAPIRLIAILGRPLYRGPHSGWHGFCRGIRAARSHQDFEPILKRQAPQKIVISS